MTKLKFASLVAAGAIVMASCVPPSVLPVIELPANQAIQTSGWASNSGWPGAVVPPQPLNSGTLTTASMRVTPKVSLFAGKFLEIAFDQAPDVGTSLKVYLDDGVLFLDTNAREPYLDRFKLSATHKVPGWDSYFKVFTLAAVAVDPSCDGGPSVVISAITRYHGGLDEGGESLHLTTVCDPTGQVKSWLDNGW